MTHTYQGKCHCGAIQFTFESEPITIAMRCNCSICRRKNAIMSRQYYTAEAFELRSGKDSLSVYRFAPEMVNHYFCKRCGIYPFHDGVENPGIYRVNLGCVDEIDTWSLPIKVFDGKDTWKYLK
ncbi:MAG: GFA family protein [Gammaproteobacteria bacterium]|nr:GFA family protein [Gammaproteobacteria bacterium]